MQINKQLRARGIYVDYMSDALRARINCLDLGGSGDTCDVPDVTTALEIIPFYDVQLTWLARWNETPTNQPIDVTNDAIKDNNTHSRGVASVTTNDASSVAISSAVHSGNLGLTGTDPVDTWYNHDLETYYLYAFAGVEDDGGGSGGGGGETEPPEDNGVLVSGTIQSSVGGVKAADVEIEADGALCDRTNTGFECVIAYGTNNPRITVSNYFKRNKVLEACSSTMTTNGTEHSGDTPSQNWTRFNLPSSNTTIANVVIREDTC